MNFEAQNVVLRFLWHIFFSTASRCGCSTGYSWNEENTENKKKTVRVVSGNRIETFFALFFFSFSLQVVFVFFKGKVKERFCTRRKVRKGLQIQSDDPIRGANELNKYKFSFIFLERSSRFEINFQYQFKNDFLLQRKRHQFKLMQLGWTSLWFIEHIQLNFELAK